MVSVCHIMCEQATDASRVQLQLSARSYNLRLNKSFKQIHAHVRAWETEMKCEFPWYKERRGWRRELFRRRGEGERAKCAGKRTKGTNDRI